MNWAIVTGEYAPDPGGVADFTATLAQALVRAGDPVHVFAPGRGPAAGDEGVRVHRVHGLGPASLAAVARAVERIPEPRRLLIQWVPHAFGWRGMNLALVGWLRSRADPIDVIFHEVAFPRTPGQPWRHALLARVQHAMARSVARAAGRVFVAAGAWAPLLRALGAPREPTWLPVPSNLPTAADPAHVAARRRALCPAGEGLVGHFGTFGPSIASLLLPSLSALLAARGDLRVLLVGRGSGAFGEQLRRVARVGPDRVIATGGLDGRGAAEHLAAADLLVQPYPDGVTTRRSSLMAGLALGVPVVTNAGPLTEDLWERSGAVALGDGPGDLAGTSERLLSDPESRRRTGRKGATLYAERFAVEHAVAAIRRAAEGA